MSDCPDIDAPMFSALAGGFSVIPGDRPTQLIEKVFDLMRKKEPFSLPDDTVLDLSLPVKRWEPKPACLLDADYVYIDPLTLYGFEVLENRLL